MKRRMLGVVLTLLGSIGSLLSASIPAYGAASGQCGGGSTYGCITLIINLNITNGGTITSPATVWVNRQEASGVDNAFTLDPDGSNTRYTSVRPIFDTNQESSPCANAPGSPATFYRVTISGSATGASPTAFQLCDNADPKGQGGNGPHTKTFTVNVQANGSGTPTKGGIRGDFNNIDLAGNVRACDPGQPVTFTGPSTGITASLTTNTLNGKANSHFDTGLSLNPGLYDVQVNCSANGAGGPVQVLQVNVVAGQTTDIGLHSCSATANNCGAGGGPTLTPTPTPTDDTPAVDCDAGAFTWAICPIIKTLLDIVEWIRDSVLVPFLKEPPLSAQDDAGKDVPAYTIWASMRNIASIFFILVFFFIIIGTAAGFDNYTIKKVLPHLIAGALLVPLSWFICAIVIDVSNVIGQGLTTLVNGVLPPPKIDFSTPIGNIFFGTTGVLVVGIAYVAFTSIGLAVLITIALALLTTFMTLILRKILIIMFIILSPFALLAWVLPNTEKWFQRWWSNFLKLVMLYPFMMLFIEAGRIASTTAGAAFGAQIHLLQIPFQVAALGVHPMFAAIGTDALVAFGSLICLLCLYIPPVAAIFVAPKFMGEAGDFAGGMVKKATGAADSRYGKGSDFAKKLEEGRARKNTEAAKNAETDAKAAHAQGGVGGHLRGFLLNRKASMNWSRAGLGTSVPGVMTGSDKLRRSKAAGNAAEELGTIDAEARQSKEADPERFSARRESTAQSILDRKLDERGGRQGVLDAKSGSAAVQDHETKERQRSARLQARDNQLAGIGTASGIVEDDRVNRAEGAAGSERYVSPKMRIDKARDVAALGASNARGEVRGVVQGSVTAEAKIESELDPAITATMSPTQKAQAARFVRLRTTADAKAITTTAEQVVNQQTANTTVSGTRELDQETQDEHLAELNKTRATAGLPALSLAAASASGQAVTLQQARQMRLKNLAAATGEHVREKLGLDESNVDAALEVEHEAGQEGMKKLLQGGRLAAREQIAMARTLRETRAELQGDGKQLGSMTTAEALEAAREEAGDRLGASVGSGKQAIEQARVDRARAAREGMPGAAPTLENKVIKGMEDAKESGATRSAARIAAANAVREGTAASTVQRSDAALFAAERVTAASNATAKATAATVNAEIDNKAAQLQARGVAPAAARKQAVAAVRKANLGATAAAAEVAAIRQTETAVGADQAIEDALKTEIDAAEQVLVGAGATAGAATRAIASNSVMRDRADSARSSARSKGRRDETKTARLERGVKNDVDKENARQEINNEIIDIQRAAQAAHGSTLPPEMARQQAIDRIAARAGTVAGDAARLLAETDVRNRELNAIGDETERVSELANREEPEGALEANKELAGQIANEVDEQEVLDEIIDVQRAAQAAGAALPPDMARKQAIDRIAARSGTAAATAARAAAKTNAAARVTATNRSNAIVAAGETGRKRQADRTEQNTEIAKQRAATLNLSAQEAARRDATNAKYNEVMATRQQAVDAKYNELMEEDAAGNRVHLDPSSGETLFVNRDKDSPDYGKLVDKDDTKLDAEGKPAIVPVVDNDGHVVTQEGTATRPYIDINTGKPYTPEAARIEAEKAGDALALEARKASKKEGEKARLEAEAKVKSGAISKEEQERIAQRTAAEGLREIARVELSNRQGAINARAQGALSPNALDESQRQIAATETAVAQVADELAITRANLASRAPGEDLNRTFLDAEAGRTVIQQDLILEQAVQQESMENFSYRKRDKDGKEEGPVLTARIEGMPVPNDASDAARDEIIRCLRPTDGSKPNKARAIALARQLGTIGHGQNNLRYIQETVFGKGWKRTVDTDLFDGQAQQLWLQMVKGITGAPDFFLPGKAIHDGVDAETMSKWNWRAIQDYITDVTEKADEDERPALIEEATQAIMGWATNDNLKGSIDADKARALYGFLYPPKVDKVTGIHREGNLTTIRMVDIPVYDASGKPVITGTDSQGKPIIQTHKVSITDLIESKTINKDLTDDQIKDRKDILGVDGALGTLMERARSVLDAESKT